MQVGVNDIKRQVRMEDYLDQEVESVEAFVGPKIRFSHIASDTTGLRPYQQKMKEEVYSLWDRMAHQRRGGAGLHGAVDDGFDGCHLLP